MRRRGRLARQEGEGKEALSAFEHHYAPAGAPGATPPLVFLHEGLGCISRWKSFPWELRRALGNPATLVYSRQGYGRTPVSALVLPASDWLQHEATVVLPRLLGSFGHQPPLLVGHSDGATIAMMHAAAGFPVAGLVVMAPHVFLEPETVEGVRRASVRFADRERLERLAAHHDDPAATVQRWCSAWLAPQMAGWSLEPSLPGVTAPVLAVQGDDDAYGTAAHVEIIRRAVGGSVQTLLLEDVGHEPHLEAPEAVVAAITDFCRTHVTGPFSGPTRRTTGAAQRPHLRALATDSHLSPPPWLT